MNNINSKPIVFLDRDGTINVEKGYIKNLDNFELITRAGQAIKLLNNNNITTVLTSNQTGAARNYYPIEHIYALHEKLKLLLSADKAHLDLYLFCPHLVNATNSAYNLDCDCRKPKVGMLEQAYKVFTDHNPRHCYIVGDKPCDIELAKAWQAKLKVLNKNPLNIKSILVKTGYGQETLQWSKDNETNPDFLAESLYEACEFIIDDASKL